MQTRRQARQAQLEADQAAATAAQAATSLPPTPPLTRDASPFSSTLSSLTPSSSFVSDAGPSQPQPNPNHLSTVNEEPDDVNERPAAIIARAFGVPHFPARGNHRALTTPVHSLYYPPEVFETPRKHAKPTDKELRTAEWARDVELAADERMRLTRTGTLLVPNPEPLQPGQGLGIGLGSAFVSPGAQNRSTAVPSRALKRVQAPKTRMVNPETVMHLRTTSRAVHNVVALAEEKWLRSL
ncbi:hypothetical protein C8F01DRAFT_1094798 [Mycena amicta]|nr:hypothetical protein C8F01DRAFT_1094798 [Mycena amicta]